MQFFDALKKLTLKYPDLPERDLQNMLQDEAEAQKNVSALPKGPRRESACVDSAFERMCDWIDNGHAHRAQPSDVQSLIDLVASHRRAAVWCVLVSKQRNEAAARASVADQIKHEQTAAKPEREPMQCPKCKEGTLQLRTDAYTFRPIFAITATRRPTTTGGTWLDYDMQSGDIYDVSEYQDYSITCTECDHEGHEGDFVTEATEPDATA